MQLTTEGLNAQADSFSLSANLDDSKQSIVLSVCFLDRNADKAMTYLSEILATPNFDDSSHLSDLIKSSSVDIANSIGDKSLDYGLSFASSGIKKFARDYDRLKSDLLFCELGAKVLSTSNPKHIFDDLIFNLTDLASYAIREENISFAVTGDKKKFGLV
jgi:Zn-dependent M16 (insulinase) family peptidase